MKRTKLWLVWHHHRHGDDFFHVLSVNQPDPEKVIIKAGSEPELHREDEYAEVSEVVVPGMTLPDVPARTFRMCE